MEEKRNSENELREAFLDLSERRSEILDNELRKKRKKNNLSRFFKKAFVCVLALPIIALLVGLAVVLAIIAIPAVGGAVYFSLIKDTIKSKKILPF